MQQYAELYHLTSLNSLQRLIVSLMNVIKYFRREFNTNRSEKRPHWLTEMKMISLETTEFKDNPKNEVKNDEAHSFWVSLQQFKMLHLDIDTNYSEVCNVLVCMPSRGIRLMRQSDVCWGLPDLDQGITELLDHLSCKLGGSDGLKHVPKLFYWI